MKFYFLLIVFITGCTLKTSSPNSQITIEDSLKNTLVGKWGGLGESSPVWEIKPDSIYYFQRAAAYPYKIIGNDMIIDLPDSKGILKNIHAIKDTLFFLDDQGILIRGYRF